MTSEWPLWEVFIRSQHGLAHKHAGSLHAPDAGMAVKNARDVYTRRNEGVSIWVVRARMSSRASPGDREALFDPAQSKVYRHPTFFPMPDEVKHITRWAAAQRSSSCCASATTRWCSPSACPSGWQGAGARGGHRADQRRARPARPGAAVALATPARSKAPAATRTRSRSGATPTSSAMRCWSSSRTATTPTRWRGSSCSTRSHRAGAAPR